MKKLLLLSFLFIFVFFVNVNTLQASDYQTFAPTSVTHTPDGGASGGTSITIPPSNPFLPIRPGTGGGGGGPINPNNPRIILYGSY